jgi:hypothetical protein
VADIQGAEHLTRIFGTWPTFHDAEVLRVRLDHNGEVGASLEIEVHVFEMTSEVHDRGYFVLRHHTLATIRFDGLSALDMRRFTTQNVIAGLNVEEVSEPEDPSLVWRVELDSSVGMEASFDCAAITVTKAQPVTG